MLFFSLVKGNRCLEVEDIDWAWAPMVRESGGFIAGHGRGDGGAVSVDPGCMNMLLMPHVTVLGTKDTNALHILSWNWLEELKNNTGRERCLAGVVGILHPSRVDNGVGVEVVIDQVPCRIEASRSVELPITSDAATTVNNVQSTHEDLRSAGRVVLSL